MNRVQFPRLAEAVSTLRHFLFKIAKPFLPVRTVMLYEVNHTAQLVRRGAHDEAVAMLDRVIDSNPGISLLYALRGNIYQLKLRHDKALADFNVAINLDGADVDCYVARGTVWAALREYERAIDDFTISIELEPRTDAYSARGDAFMAIGKYIAAMDDYERVIGRRPDAVAYEARGTAYFCLNSFEDALNDFNTSIRLDPTMATPYVMRGNIRRRQGDHEAAAEEYAHVIALMADIADADGLKFVDGDVKSHLYELAVQDVGTAYCGRGISRSRAGDFAGALSDFGAAIRIMPEQASFYLARAVAYTEHGEHAEALRDLEVASRLDERSADIHCIRASVNLNREEFDEALQDCHRAIGLSPRWADPLCLRGRVLMRLGDHHGAIDDFGKAIELGPGKPQVWHEPWHERSSGMTLTLGLGRSAAYAYRGLAYLLLGDEAKGREDIVEGAELGYAQAEIEEEVEALLSDERDRRAMVEVVRSAMVDARAERKDHRRRVASTVRNSRRNTEPHVPSGNSSSGDLQTLSKEAYTSLFQRLGFHDIRVGRTLKHSEPIPSIYFNSRYGVVYFVAYVKDRERYRPGLWRLIPPRRMRDDRENLITIVPRVGRERQAFEQLLVGDEEFGESVQQLQISATRVMVNDYRGRNPKDTVNGEPVSGVIHLATCRHVPENPGWWWDRFNSLEAAHAVFGAHAATCAACLAGEGRHLDRVQRA